MAASGLADPCGGIVPPRSLRMTFSHVAALTGASAPCRASRSRPAVLSLELWQADAIALQGGARVVLLRERSPASRRQEGRREENRSHQNRPRMWGDPFRVANVGRPFQGRLREPALL